MVNAAFAIRTAQMFREASMFSAKIFFSEQPWAGTIAAVVSHPAASAETGFRSVEMTLDASRPARSKRIPTLGDRRRRRGDPSSCGAKGARTVFGRRHTVIFVAGPWRIALPAARAQGDDELVAALSGAATWKRQGDWFVRRNQPLRFRLHTTKAFRAMVAPLA